MNRDNNDRDREDAAGHGSIRAGFSDAETAEGDDDSEGHGYQRLADTETAEGDDDTEGHAAKWRG